MNFPKSFRLLFLNVYFELNLLQLFVRDNSEFLWMKSRKSFYMRGDKEKKDSHFVYIKIDFIFHSFLN